MSIDWDENGTLRHVVGGYDIRTGPQQLPTQPASRLGDLLPHYWRTVTYNQSTDARKKCE